MTPAQLVLLALQIGEKLGPLVAAGFKAVLTEHVPELLPPPGERLDNAIEEEDEAAILRRFHSDR